VSESVADQVLASRRERIRRGVAECREALADTETERGLARATEQPSLSDGEVRHARALARAAAEKRGRRLAGTE
jgi:hypothetical protein